MVCKDARYNSFRYRLELECLHVYRMVCRNDDTEYDHVTLPYSSFARALPHDCHNDGRAVQCVHALSGLFLASQVELHLIT